ncbi:DUF2256 domain-containing protein [Aureimonas sp. N4]|uniref:DUF2256 domain-containing protein n=1 Tax=Aureimonas sp. N4 TaxID=1638165 RepID=UPI000780AFBC|nr:DUF2256 domain-containing protein [Aureimonas sp. N4]
MPKMKKKSDLPSKLCRECQKPMVWRKAWARTWDQVLYCSDRCQKEASRKRHDGMAQADRITRASPN